MFSARHRMTTGTVRTRTVRNPERTGGVATWRRGRPLDLPRDGRRGWGYTITPGEKL